eukprot:CAMPEP_0116876176 /NCGR_PEP_ID=MMETSP0463-20121206/8185_1 /TAXON_ID=181622 /ORGANISM="Strombidinopsis sp, Strain SopsisLIS2011" /LENGTH=52 /DNA_ID=CAMNT_0004522653 /DNA_START=141 /DNA_END=299 /DNA_ORIENTATION=+
MEDNVDTEEELKANAQAYNTNTEQINLPNNDGMAWGACLVNLDSTIAVSQIP